MFMPVLRTLVIKAHTFTVDMWFILTQKNSDSFNTNQVLIRHRIWIPLMFEGRILKKQGKGTYLILPLHRHGQKVHHLQPSILT
jgi:hypothetical protein